MLVAPRVAEEITAGERDVESSRSSSERPRLVIAIAAFLPDEQVVCANRRMMRNTFRHSSHQKRLGECFSFLTFATSIEGAKDGNKHKNTAWSVDLSHGVNRCRYRYRYRDTHMHVCIYDR